MSFSGFLSLAHRHVLLAQTYMLFFPLGAEEQLLRSHFLDVIIIVPSKSLEAGTAAYFDHCICLKSRHLAP